MQSHWCSGNSEISCVIDQDSKRFLTAVPVGHTDESRPATSPSLIWLCGQRPTARTRTQLLDAQTQLEAACRDQHLTRMLKGVVTNVHCLMKFSREAGLTPYLGPARYIYACYLRSATLNSVWSCRLSGRPSDRHVPWMFLLRCDMRTRVALRIMPREHPSQSQLGPALTTIVAMCKPGQLLT